MTESQFDDNVKMRNDRIKVLEDERDKLHVELSGLHRQFDTRAKLDLKRTDVKKKHDGIHTLLSNFARLIFSFICAMRFYISCPLFVLSLVYLWNASSMETNHRSELGIWTGSTAMV